MLAYNLARISSVSVGWVFCISILQRLFSVAAEGSIITDAQSKFVLFYNQDVYALGMLLKRRETSPNNAKPKKKKRSLAVPCYEAMQAKSPPALKHVLTASNFFVSLYFAISTPPVAPRAFLTSP